MNKSTFVLLFLANSLPILGAAKSVVAISPRAWVGALAGVAGATSLVPAHTPGQTHPLDEQKSSRRNVQAERALVAALKPHSLSSEEKDEGITLLPNHNALKEILDNSQSEPVLKLLARYLQNGMGDELTDSTGFIPDFLHTRRLIVASLRGLLNLSEETVREIWRCGNSLNRKKRPGIIKIISLQNALPVRSSEKYTECVDRLKAEQKEFELFVDSLHPEWSQTAEPLLVLYYTVYYQTPRETRNNFKGRGVETPDQVRIPGY